MAYVECAEDGSSHWNSKVKLIHCWNIRSQCSNNITAGNPAAAEGGGEAATPVMGLVPGEVEISIDKRS